MPAGLRARPPLPMPLLLRPLPSGLAGIISTRARTGALQGRAGLPQAAPVETQALELRSRVHLSGYRSGGALTTDIHVPRPAVRPMTRLHVGHLLSASKSHGCSGPLARMGKLAGHAGGTRMGA